MIKLLIINPGSTSTKVAVYGDKKPLFVENIDHPSGELARFGHLNDQLELRREYVVKAVREHGVSLEELAAVVGRGGQISPLKSGGYRVNQAMLDGLKLPKVKAHASNLGAMIAQSIAEPLGVPAFIYDAVGSDELADVAKITGLPEVTRQSFGHVLNSKATARKVAEGMGKTYRDCRFIVAHIGGGISISAHDHGRIVDIITDDAGPFSPERSGSIPLNYIIDICYSGEYTYKELMDKIKRESGIKGHLGTNDCREVERRIEQGDEKARRIYEAQTYQIAKGIGEMAPVLCGDVEAVIITGGMARSEFITQEVKRRVGYIAPVVIVPGENEMEALALGALRILRGEEPYHEYGVEGSRYIDGKPGSC